MQLAWGVVVAAVAVGLALLAAWLAYSVAAPAQHREGERVVLIGAAVIGLASAAIGWRAWCLFVGC